MAVTVEGWCQAWHSGVVKERRLEARRWDTFKHFSPHLCVKGNATFSSPCVESPGQLSWFLLHPLTITGKRVWRHPTWTTSRIQLMVPVRMSKEEKTERGKKKKIVRVRKTVFDGQSSTMPHHQNIPDQISSGPAVLLWIWQVLLRNLSFAVVGQLDTRWSCLSTLWIWESQCG